MPRLPITSASATTIELDGRELLYFGGCGYLGLAHHPRVVEALLEGARRFGLSSGASRETTGNAVVHDELEARIAACVERPAALLTPEGCTANFVAAQALAQTRSVALVDERAHASLFDAARAARLEVRALPHGDLDGVARELGELGARAVCMTDGVFPSRGETAPVRELAALTSRFGAALLLDDCHGTGVLGAHGRGVLEHAGVGGDGVVLTSTLSKALGCYGGFVAASRELVELARAQSPVYVGSTPPPPALACAALAALGLAFDDARLVERMRANSEFLRAGFLRLGLPVPREHLPVFAFTLPRPESMQRLHERLLAGGILAPLVRYLGSPQGGNFRIVVSAAHRAEDLERLLNALESGLRSAAT